MVSSANRVALDGRVIKVKLAGEVQRFLMGAVDGAMAAALAIRAVIQSGFGLTDDDALAMKCLYLDEEGDLCTLNRLTLADWTQQHARGPLKIHISLKSSDVESSWQSAKCAELRGASGQRRGQQHGNDDELQRPPWRPRAERRARVRRPEVRDWSRG